MKYTLVPLPKPDTARDLEEFCSKYGLELVVTERKVQLIPDEDDPRFVAHLVGAEVRGKNKGIMGAAGYGYPGGKNDRQRGGGGTPEAAVADYLRKIEGYTLLIVATRQFVLMPLLQPSALEEISETTRDQGK